MLEVFFFFYYYFISLPPPLPLLAALNLSLSPFLFPSRSLLFILKKLKKKKKKSTGRGKKKPTPKPSPGFILRERKEDLASLWPCPAERKGRDGRGGQDEAAAGCCGRGIAPVPVPIAVFPPPPPPLSPCCHRAVTAPAPAPRATRHPVRGNGTEKEVQALQPALK